MKRKGQVLQIPNYAYALLIGGIMIGVAFVALEAFLNLVLSSFQ